MGIQVAADFRQHLPFPDTPPELVSPGCSSYSSRSAASEAQTLATAPSTLSMSHSDKSSAAEPIPAMKRESSSHTTEAIMATTANRQQLPSLSSLFGPPVNARPLHSPASDRPGSYPITSPLDRPRIPSSIDRNGAGSYFSQVNPPSSSAQPRSTLDHKLDPLDRPPLHALKRTYSGSSSPGYRDVAGHRTDPRADSDGVSKWTMPHDPSRQEYTFGSREYPHRPSAENFRLHFPGTTKDHHMSYSEHRSTHPNPPPTPTSTIGSEGMSKDGLGPKIWTGTHFLPRFVRATEVPGEGLCYFYDDGSHCKTVIDGEAVNAHWGVTKAGKPRKRLAIACMTCREKKIKCDPDFPRCVQCEKFGRICKFKNAPRGGQNGSPTTPPAELDDLRKLGGPSRPMEYRSQGSDAGSPISPRTAAPIQRSPSDSSYKRLKVDGETYRETHRETYRDGYHSTGDRSSVTSQPMDHSKAGFAARQRTREVPRIPENVLNRAWQTDPYVSDPQSIIAVVSHFFANVEHTMILRLLPQEATMAWISGSAHRKTPEDLMLLYSMLAVGVALSDGPRNIAFEYAQVAHYAQKMMQGDCLQLVQSRVILALYYVSTYRLREATELIASAAAAASSLQLHVEIDDSVEAQRPSYPLNMTRAGFAESRRRTMWSLFMLERLSGLFPQQPAIINAEDICIRLPVDTACFEKQMDEAAPLFDPHEPAGPAMSGHSLDVTSYLIEIVHLWSSCQSTLFRQIRRSTQTEYEAEMKRNYLDRLQKWHDRLPLALGFESQNLESAIMAGKAGAFLTMHLLCRHASMSLARFGQYPKQMAQQKRSDSIHECREQAKAILNIVNVMGRAYRGSPSLWNPMPPAATCLVSEAVDILSSSGPVTDLDVVIDAITLARPVLKAMGGIWDNQRASAAMIEERLNLLHCVKDNGSTPPSPVGGYRMIRGSPNVSSDTGLHWQLEDGLRTPAREGDVLFFSP